MRRNVFTCFSFFIKDQVFNLDGGIDWGIVVSTIRCLLIRAWITAKSMDNDFSISNSFHLFVITMKYGERGLAGEPFHAPKVLCILAPRGVA